MVVAEAAALGVPCIVSDSCAGRDFVDNGNTGLWFNGGNRDSLANAISRLKNDPVFAKKLGETAYSKYWKSPPNVAAHVQALTECYNAIISKNK
ncbi:Glycosyl transferases group 1 [compost metagenome]